MKRYEGFLLEAYDPEKEHERQQRLIAEEQRRRERGAEIRSRIAISLAIVQLLIVAVEIIQKFG